MEPPGLAWEPPPAIGPDTTSRVDAFAAGLDYFWSKSTYDGAEQRPRPIQTWQERTLIAAGRKGLDAGPAV